MVTTVETFARALVPMCYFLASSAFSMIALHVSLSRRVYFLPPLLITGWLSFHQLTGVPSWYGLDSLWGLFILTYLVHIITVLYIDKITLSSTNHSGDTAHFQWNFHAARRIWNDPRRLHTAQKHFSCNTDPLQHHRAIARFVLTRISKLLVYCMLSYVISAAIFPTPFRPLTPSDFSPQKESFIRRLLLSSNTITVRETLLRLILGVHWIWIAYVLLQSSHHILAIIFVGILRIDSPDEWPPLFGNVQDITSIRAFWGKFWHRIVYRPYRTCALLLSRNLLALEPDSAAEKVLVSAILFLLSGIAHSAVSWQMGQRCGVWRDTAWFCGNFAAAGLETMLKRRAAAFARDFGVTNRYDRLTSGLVGRVVGGLWVWAFFAWSVPKWQYGKIYCAMLEHAPPVDHRKVSPDLFADLAHALGST